MTIKDILTVTGGRTKELLVTKDKEEIYNEIRVVDY